MTNVCVSPVALEPWSALPSLGDFPAYLRAIKRFPLLSAQEEESLAIQLRQEGNLQAAARLVLSNLRLVVSIARQYLGYGLAHEDLVQEGNIGLMRAVRNFDPSKGARLATYATYWIKFEIHEYILRNWRLVKIATTKAQRKLFFRLRSLKKNLMHEDQSSAHTLTESHITSIAQTLDVPAAEVRHMEQAMASEVISLSVTNDSDEASTIDLPDMRFEPSACLERDEADYFAHTKLIDAIDTLDERSRHIVKARWLVDEDADEKRPTLHDLAAQHGISYERVRQIEVAAFKKLREKLK